MKVIHYRHATSHKSAMIHPTCMVMLQSMTLRWHTIHLARMVYRICLSTHLCRMHRPRLLRGPHLTKCHLGVLRDALRSPRNPDTLTFWRMRIAMTRTMTTG